MASIALDRRLAHTREIRQGWRHINFDPLGHALVARRPSTLRHLADSYHRRLRANAELDTAAVVRQPHATGTPRAITLSHQDVGNVGSSGSSHHGSSRVVSGPKNVKAPPPIERPIHGNSSTQTEHVVHGSSSTQTVPTASVDASTQAVDEPSRLKRLLSTSLPLPSSQIFESEEDRAFKSRFWNALDELAVRPASPRSPSPEEDSFTALTPTGLQMTPATRSYHDFHRSINTSQYDPVHSLHDELLTTIGGLSQRLSQAVHGTNEKEDIVPIGTPSKSRGSHAPLFNSPDTPPEAKGKRADAKMAAKYTLKHPQGPSPSAVQKKATVHAYEPSKRLALPSNSVHRKAIRSHHRKIVKAHVDRTRNIVERYEADKSAYGKRQAEALAAVIRNAGPNK
jgi:hypothetical protein